MYIKHTPSPSSSSFTLPLPLVTPPNTVPILQFCLLLLISKSMFKGVSQWFFSKILKRGAGRVAQVVECLPSKCEILSLSPSTEKKKCWKHDSIDLKLLILIICIVYPASFWVNLCWFLKLTTFMNELWNLANSQCRPTFPNPIFFLYLELRLLVYLQSYDFSSILMNLQRFQTFFMKVG
jgi:hypothetical protein